jgi:hypothetical protein
MVCNDWDQASCKMGIHSYMSDQYCFPDSFSHGQGNFFHYICRYSAEMQDDGNFVIYVSIY